MRLLVAASAALVLALAPAELAVRAAAPEGDGLQEFENCYIGTRHVHTWRRRCCAKLASYLSRLASKTCEASQASVSALRGGAGVHGVQVCVADFFCAALAHSSPSPWRARTPRSARVVLRR